jgi:hypothetical protein
MYLSKTSAYAASRPHPVSSIPNSSSARPENGDGIKDTPSQAPVKQMGNVGTIINTKA